jgi:uncharacterized protein YjbJ (UPF0337 family)
MAMDENRVAGTVRNVGGKVEEGLGRVTGDTKAQTEGLVNQAAGTAQNLYGQARDSAADATDVAKDTVVTFEKWLRRTIETQPYTTAIVAVGIGWLLGRMHRPLWPAISATDRTIRRTLEVPWFGAWSSNHYSKPIYYCLERLRIDQKANGDRD